MRLKRMKLFSLAVGRDSKKHTYQTMPEGPPVKVNAPISYWLQKHERLMKKITIVGLDDI